MTIIVDASLSVISNASIVAEVIDPPKKTVHFADTIKMSTYLVTFMIGHLESTASQLVGRTSLRLWSLPGKQRLTEFGLKVAVAALNFFVEYYSISYPGDKLDLVAFPTLPLVGWPRGTSEKRPMRDTSKPANGVRQDKVVITHGRTLRQRKTPQDFATIGYSDSTWAEDMAPQGCDQSADPAAGMRGRR